MISIEKKSDFRRKYDSIIGKIVIPFVVIILLNVNRELDVRNQLLDYFILFLGLGLVVDIYQTVFYLLNRKTELYYLFDAEIVLFKNQKKEKYSFHDIESIYFSFLRNALILKFNKSTKLIVVLVGIRNQQEIIREFQRTSKGMAIKYSAGF